jgi:hypothetical protein
LNVIVIVAVLHASLMINTVEDPVEKADEQRLNPVHTNIG